jgi:glycine cleavage system H protein
VDSVNNCIISFIFSAYLKFDYLSMKYTKDHEWITIDGDVATIGITNFAQGELGEIVYVDVDTVGETLGEGDVFGTVEAVKTTSDLFLPVAGEVLEFNSEISEDDGDNPAIINEDAEGKGWIIKMKVTDLSELDNLLSKEDYEKLIG